MRIKKHANGNQYLLTPQSKWVRNFAKSGVPNIDINKTIKSEDHFLLLQNEFNNSLNRYAWIDSEKYYHPNVVIVSDGFNFEENHKIIDSLPSNIVFIGVNGSLKKWQAKRNMSYYVVNNPYNECMKYLPRSNKLLPKCIASSRTNSNFLKNYNGTRFKYYPVNEQEYKGMSSKEVMWQIDDYRNSICAAVGLSYRFGAEKLLLLCCDNVFKDERAGASQLENKLWIYPQQNIVHGLIDANLYWFSNQEYYATKAGDCSSGPLYDYAAYIELDKILNFFES